MSAGARVSEPSNSIASSSSRQAMSALHQAWSAAPIMVRLQFLQEKLAPIACPSRVGEPSARVTSSVAGAAEEIERFIDARCERGSKNSERAQALYSDYESWCEIERRDPVGIRTFGEALRALGCRRKKSNTVIYVGLELRRSERIARRSKRATP